MNHTPAYYGPPYIHQPLPLPPEVGRHPPYTRILILSPGSGSQPFHGRLEVGDVEQWTNTYEALSYTWGTEESVTCIWLDGRPLSIKPNLEKALSYIRLPDLARRVWIDALCIDQTNVDERTRQVQYMTKVYKHAARTIAWIGAKSPGIELAFDAIKAMASVREMVKEDISAGPGRQIDDETSKEIMAATVASLPEGTMQSLVDLYARPYLARSWVIQEVSVCSWAVAKCEELEVSFLDLIGTSHTVLEVVNLQGDAIPDKPIAFWSHMFVQKTIPGFFKTNVQGSLGPLLDVLQRSREFKATDPRDKIFSLLGICDEGMQPELALTQVMTSNGQDSSLAKMLRKAVGGVSGFINNLDPTIDFGRPAALKPDYSKDCVSVYCDATRFQIRRSPRLLRVLSHVQHTDEKLGGEYPSWVPKWFEPKSVTTIGESTFLAGLCNGHFRYFANIHDSPLGRDSVRPRVLSLDGYLVDTVQSVTSVLKADLNEGIPLMSFWSELFDFPFFRPHPCAYRSGAPLDLEFCKTMTVAPLGAAMHHVLSRVTSYQPEDINFGTEELKHMADCDAAHFVYNFAQANEVPLEPYQPLLADAANSLPQRFMIPAMSCSHNRRLFLTHQGRLGLGPMMMQPGDQVVVLYGGRMPFILRPRGDHYSFIGDCYVRDDDVMWGDMTERVRYNKGGPPVATFEMR